MDKFLQTHDETIYRIERVIGFVFRLALTLFALALIFSFIPFLFLMLFLIRDLSYWYLPYMATFFMVAGGSIMALLYPKKQYRS